jgi:2-methylcitrate dehydratase PrpD
MKPVQREHPRPGATACLVEFAARLKYAALPEDVRHHARRHLLDTIGVMVAGAQGDLCRKAQAVLGGTSHGECVAVPGREERASVLDAAFLGGTAAHGIEFDDGFRQGSVHPGAWSSRRCLPQRLCKKRAGRRFSRQSSPATRH